MAATTGTPDGHGYDGTGGTFRSLGNGGTAGTEGNAAATAEGATGAGAGAGADAGAGVGCRTGVVVAKPITFPAESTEATTSTLTVTTLWVSCTGRRWNMRWPLDMAARLFCSRIRSGSLVPRNDSTSSSASTCAVFLLTTSRVW